MRKPRTKNQQQESYKHRKEQHSRILSFAQPFEQGIRGPTPAKSCELILPCRTVGTALACESRAATAVHSNMGRMFVSLEPAGNS